MFVSGCDNERDCRRICDKIMFELHAPQECIDKGITDPEECGRFMDSFRGPDGPMDGRRGPRGPDCMSIEDPMKRLECYDNKGNEFDDHYGPGPGEPGDYDDSGEPPSDDSVDTETPSSDSGSSDSSGDDSGSDSGSSDSGSSDSGGDSSGDDAAPVTGNAFLEYYWD